jgi:hypothetical protein
MLGDMAATSSRTENEGVGDLLQLFSMSIIWYGWQLSMFLDLQCNLTHKLGMWGGKTAHLVLIYRMVPIPPLPA